MIFRGPTQAKPFQKRESIMDTTNVRTERVELFWFWWLPLLAGVTLFLALTIWAGLVLAQAQTQLTYASPREAGEALFDAVQSDNVQAIVRILGARSELVSAGDEVEDKAERKQFAAKYAEMHRLVRRADGSMVLYIGAENWPFPVPIVSKAGRWFFDADGGAREILFRQIGENEVAAIETCRALVSGDSPPATDDSIIQYARSLIEAQTSAATPDSKNGPGNEEPFNGYYFRIWTPGRKGESANATKTKPALIAYPAEYRSSGVMTFIVTYDGVVYEKDLGPNTATVARTMTKWHSDSSWHPVE